MLNTFKTMGKQVRLVDTDVPGKYDISVINGDFEMREDLSALDTAIEVKVLTIFGELWRSPPYVNWGNKAHLVIKRNKTRLSLMEIKEYCREAILSMRRIQSVDLITVRGEKDWVYVDWTVTSISDQQLSGRLKI